MSLSDSRLSSFSLYPWNPGIASSIFSWRLVWDLARSKYGFVVELKLRPLFYRQKQNLILLPIKGVKTRQPEKSLRDHLSQPAIRTQCEHRRESRSGLSKEQLQNDYVR